MSLNSIQARAGIRFVGALLALGLIAASPLRPRDDSAVAGDLKPLQGVWIFEVPEVGNREWKIEGSKLKAEVNNETYECTLKLDSKAEPHATVDFTITGGPAEFAGKTVKGLYKINDETLTFCVSNPESDQRPGDFDPIEDQVFVFKLKKKK